MEELTQFFIGREAVVGHDDIGFLRVLEPDTTGYHIRQTTEVESEKFKVFLIADPTIMIPINIVK
jgi:hypothetical protein